VAVLSEQLRESEARADTAASAEAAAAVTVAQKEGAVAALEARLAEWDASRDARVASLEAQLHEEMRSASEREQLVNEIRGQLATAQAEYDMAIQVRYGGDG
jgi:hypothetical protein